MNNVGFIGLGAIGRPMASHIADAFGVVAWNRTGETAAVFARETGARAVNTVREVIEQVDTVITCLPTSTEVMAIVRSGGDAWRKGHLLIDATSGDPSGSREIAAELAKVGAGFVDAPVSGGTSGAQAAKLTVMLGGEEPWISRALDIVRPYSSKVEHVGPVGSAHALKAVNQALLAVNIVAAGEGLAALVKLGVKASVALDVINASTGRSNVTENLFPERVLPRTWPRTFRLALLDKDVGVALQVLEDTNVPSTVFGPIKHRIEEARRSLGEDADHVEIVREIEKSAGTQIV